MLPSFSLGQKDGNISIYYLLLPPLIPLLLLLLLLCDDECCSFPTEFTEPPEIHVRNDWKTVGDTLRCVPVREALRMLETDGLFEETFSVATRPRNILVVDTPPTTFGDKRVPCCVTETGITEPLVPLTPAVENVRTNVGWTIEPRSWKYRKTINNDKETM